MNLQEHAIKVWQMENTIRESEERGFDLVGFSNLDYLGMAQDLSLRLREENIPILSDMYLKFYRHSPMISNIIHNISLIWRATGMLVSSTLLNMSLRVRSIATSSVVFPAISHRRTNSGA